MAKLVTKFGYFKPGNKTKSGNYARYIATREGVEKIDESQKNKPATLKQKKLIKDILRDFPDSKQMLEYEDYVKNKTIGTASEFISRSIEENASDALGRLEPEAAVNMNRFRLTGGRQGAKACPLRLHLHRQFP